MDGAAVAIAVDAAGQPLVVNSNGDIFYHDFSWHKMPGAAHDIGASSANNLWVIGTTPTAGGYQIFRWDGGQWERVDGGAVRIAVDPQGRPWVVNNNGDIFRLTGDNQWQQMPGKGSDIAIGQDGSVWLIGTNAESGGYGIFHWIGSNWQKVEGAAVRISVDSNGRPWVVNKFGNIFKYI